MATKALPLAPDGPPPVAYEPANILRNPSSRSGGPMPPPATAPASTTSARQPAAHSPRRPQLLAYRSLTWDCPRIALRLGCHFGPVYEDTDPIAGTTNIFGTHVSRAARIEPIAPEGSYV